ncbi:hypothetical protein BH09MYX1_BH09MYX1_17730 [soil metagenome]
MNRIFLLVPLLPLLLLVPACSKSEPEPAHSKPIDTITSVSASASPSAALSAAPMASGVPGELPATIVWAPPPKLRVETGTVPMRLATYRAPKVGADKEEPTLVVSHAGGTTDANVERWMSQFNPATKKSRTDRQVGVLTATIVEVHGTFLGGMNGGGPETNHMVLGAIIPVKDGAYFFKMVGPEASVEAARADFDALVASAHP